MAGIHNIRACLSTHLVMARVGHRLMMANMGVIAMMAMAVVIAACSGGDDQQREATTASTVRSSGELAYTDTSEIDPAKPRPVNPDASGLAPDELEGETSDGSEPTGADPTADTAATDSDPDVAADQNPPVERPDGLELVFADGLFASIEPGSTIDEIAAVLGPAYSVAAEAFIRVGFPGGYGVSKGGEVQFWAIEEDGIITSLMTTNPKVGLDGGLRPTMALDDAIALHGEPTLTLGPELREFVSFGDGTGTGVEDDVVVLVAIGQFGGPVGLYEGALVPGQQTTEYVRENANIKELWFLLPKPNRQEAKVETS